MRDLRVLIAEDDPRIAEIQRLFLERLKFVELVGIAHSLQDARTQIDVLVPDLVLLDVYFPDGSGLDLIRELRANTRPTDIILITAAREVEVVRSALHGGVFSYILKPVVYERLSEVLRQYREHLERLESLSQVAQSEVDLLLPRSTSEPSNSPAVRLPKGIDALTVEAVRKVVKEGVWSAEAVGQELGVARTTARRYLEFLVSTGELTTELTYGGVGRPERRYRGQGSMSSDQTGLN
ncbi:MAG: response regulator [Saccharospirillum sp.]